VDNQEKKGCVVNFRIFALAAMTTLIGDAAMAQPALPAATTTVIPVLSGTYIVRVTHVCQPTIAVAQDTKTQGGPTVRDVTMAQSGDSNQNIGTVTFNQTTGKATLSADSIDGSPILLAHNGGAPMGTPLTDTPPPNPLPTFPYSNTSTSFTIATGSGNVTYHAFYASVNSSSKIPQFMIFGGIEKPGCTTTGIAIHQ
jgi:hypothetical protein